MIKAVLFDLDGTLVDSIPDLADSVNYALSELGFPKREYKEFNYFVGDGMPKMVERALPEGSRDALTLDKALSLFLPFYAVHSDDKTRAYEGVAELIEMLGKAGIKTAVVTNKEQSMAERVVTKIFGDRFDLIFGKREGIPAKPDPAAANMAMDELGVTPGEALFLGDSANDILAGVNSGATAVGELWGYRDEKELRESGAAYIIRHPKELIAVINELNKD